MPETRIAVSDLRQEFFISAALNLPGSLLQSQLEISRITSSLLIDTTEYCLNPMRRQFGDRKISRRTESVLQEILQVPKLSSHGIYIPNGCKHFRVFLELFHGGEANSNKPLKNEKKISGIERLVLPFPDN